MLFHGPRTATNFGHQWVDKYFLPPTGLVNNRQPIQDNGKPFGILVLEPKWCVKTLMRVQGSKLNLIHWITICRLAPMCAMTLDGRTAPGLMVGCNLGRPQSQESNGILYNYIKVDNIRSKLQLSDQNWHCLSMVLMQPSMCSAWTHKAVIHTCPFVFFTWPRNLFCRIPGTKPQNEPGQIRTDCFQKTAGKQQNHKVCLVDGKNIQHLT